MQPSAEFPQWQQDQAQVAHAAPAATKENIRENLNPDLTLHVRGHLEETGDDRGCIYDQLYSLSISRNELDIKHSQQPTLSQSLDSVLATLAGEHQKLPLRLRENAKGGETAGQSTFGEPFEPVGTSAHLAIPHQPNTPHPHPPPNTTNTTEGHEEAPPMLQRYIDDESGRDGGSVYARLFETLDTLKCMENFHNK